MAASAVLPAMNGDKVHPFFTRPNPNGATSGDECPSDTDGPQDRAGLDEHVKMRRKPRAPRATDGKTQKTLREIVNPKTKDAEDDDAAQRGPESARGPETKRRRMSEDAFVPVATHEDVRTPTKGTPPPRRLASPQVIVPVSSPLPTTAPLPIGDEPHTPPKKMLRLNASGKFSSPVSKKLKEEEGAAEPPRKRGRPRKAKEPISEKHLVVAICYPNDPNLGERIERILSGEERHLVSALPKQKRTPKKHPAKPTHPLFLGKPKEKAARPKESPRKTSAVTPGKLRRQALGKDRIQSPELSEAWTSSLLKDRLVMKHPGAQDPAWPRKETTHVRGLDERDTHLLSRPMEVMELQQRKQKAVIRAESPNESLLNGLASGLVPEEDSPVRSDGFSNPHRSISVPQRLLVSGEKLSRRVAPELHYSPADRHADELSIASQTAVHPAVQKLFDSLPRSLTAFDQGHGEAANWTQKYAPLSAAEVLQPSKETSVLKEWLKSLTITAVEGSSRVEPKAARSEVKAKKRRKRRAEDLDDFLVDSDEDVHDMDELTDPEEPDMNHTDRKSAKSIVQVGGDGVKLCNAVLLSGPHGCGKTAAAYAVAKELGFKVFEIGPCERRSGKDVLEKVGDMTENHLVKHHGIDAGEISSTEESSRVQEEFDRDLASGRQGKMSAFFKPSMQAKKILPKNKPLMKIKSGAIETIQKTLKKPAKDQQQSLILLEEVDILFKDDKDFWTTVLKLIATSKRPFIMTCNDEDMVPLQAMSLHAILRFEQPPQDLAVDYLLLMAASEGHLLKRKAIASLHASKRSDLRASIAELNMWCQMGVGDPKGGLSWIYQRYPPGSDLDEQGRRLRVVSQDTYRTSLINPQSQDLDKEDQLMWSWQQTAVDPVTALGWPRMKAMDTIFYSSLKEYNSFADALSAADVYSGSLDASDLDTTQKPMPDKARSHYIEGLQLLQTDVHADYAMLRPALAISAAVAIYRISGLLDTSSLRLDITCPTALGKHNRQYLTRNSFTCFDPISTPSDSALSTTSGLTLSSFDGPLAPIATDLAPYVRSIVQHDLALAEQRDRLSGILSGGTSRQARTTRAARSALEGSQRASTRKERWFGKGLDYEAVLKTGGMDWPKSVLGVEDLGSTQGTETAGSSAED